MDHSDVSLDEMPAVDAGGASLDIKSVLTESAVVKYLCIVT